MTGWIPRSKWFYALVSAAGSGSSYIWWDRNQATLIQEQFERECGAFGRTPLEESARLTKLTVLLAARDSIELADKRRLFRRHVARLMLSAGIDWQVIDINEQALAKAVNELRLDDGEHEEVQSIDRRELVEAVAIRCCAPDFAPGGESTDYLLKKVRVSPTACRDGLVALDPVTFDALQTGVLKGREVLRERGVGKRATSWFSKVWPGRARDQPAAEPPLHLIRISLPTSFWSKAYGLLNTRHTAADLCQQTAALIADHHQRKQQ